MCYSDPCRKKHEDHCDSCKKQRENCCCYKRDEKRRREYCHCCNRYY